LQAVLKKIKEAEPGCDFFAVNFKKRNADRTLEIEGLTKAKAILKDAKYPGEGGRLLQQDVNKHA